MSSSGNQRLLSGDLQVEERSGRISPESNWKSIIIISLSFVFGLTAYSGIQSIQSSVNSNKGLGLLSLGIVSASMIVSNLLAPAVIQLIGNKWTIVFGFLCYSMFSLASLFPSFATLIPASCLLGFSTAPLWVAQMAYQIAAENIDHANGVFYLFYYTSFLWGNIMSFSLLNEHTTLPQDLSHCGPYSCGASISSEFQPPHKSDLNLLFGLFLMFGLLAALLCICLLDKLPFSEEIKEHAGSCTSTLKLMFNCRFFFLIPVIIFGGISEAFIIGDFTKSYVTCTQGVSMVGKVMVVLGASNFAFNFIFGQLAKTDEACMRIFIFTLGAGVHLGLIIYLYLWDHEDSRSRQLFLVAFGWGAGHAVWPTQLYYLCDTEFEDHKGAAYSNCRLWESVGLCFGFLVSIASSVCVWHKLIGIGAWLIFSMVMYYIFECIKEDD